MSAAPNKWSGWKRRTLSVLGAAAVLAVVSCGSSRTVVDVHHAAPKSAVQPQVTPKAVAPSIPAIESGTLPWSLRSPISREVLAPGTSSTEILIAGGLNGSGTASGVFSLDLQNGALHDVGSLPVATHDAGSATLGSGTFLFGGGDTSVSQAVEETSPSGSAATGTLPTPRADSSAVAIGSTAYVIGGYDGTHALPDILATTTGTTFSVVARLSVPVRYAAVAAVGSTVYIFGGEEQTASGTWQATNTVQAFNTVQDTVHVVSTLPEALVGMIAVAFGQQVYVTGGEGSSGTNGTIWAFDPQTETFLHAGQLMQPVAYAPAIVVGTTAWIIGGEVAGRQTAAVQMMKQNSGFGAAGTASAGSPIAGDSMAIADRGNNRILVINDAKQLLWTYPSPGAQVPPGPKGFFFPDDVFFVHHGTALISNQEENNTIAIISYPGKKVLWTYGHALVASSRPGYLHQPDDAFLLKTGQVMVADIDNCRILIINPNGTIATQIGRTGVCKHNPPYSLGSPNGDTPLANGNILISEIDGSWISEYTPQGQLVWTTHVAVGFPSDPQQLTSSTYLVADYSSVGGLVEFNQQGTILWRYDPVSGPGRLRYPSLAEMVPSGVIIANDDYNDRIVAIDPTTGALVWQYGITGVAGTAPGYLNTPDGFDILAPGGVTPTHPMTG